MKKMITYDDQNKLQLRQGRKEGRKDIVDDQHLTVPERQWYKWMKLEKKLEQNIYIGH